MKRKLPVYIIVDSSNSMGGEPIQAVNNSAKLINRSGKSDPEVLEKAEICYIEFNDDAEVVKPMTSFAEAVEPTFSAGGMTSLGAALDKLGECIKNDVKKGDKKTETRGDYKALVFLLTDGYPNDDWEAALNRLDRSQISFIVSCLAPHYNLTNEDKDRIVKDVLTKVSGDPELVISLDSTNEEEIRRFFEFISASVSTQTKKINDPTNDKDESISIPTFPDGNEQDSAFF